MTPNGALARSLAAPCAPCARTAWTFKHVARCVDDVSENDEHSTRRRGTIQRPESPREVSCTPSN
jgi:hypothetical protein